MPIYADQLPPIFALLAQALGAKTSQEGQQEDAQSAFTNFLDKSRTTPTQNLKPTGSGETVPASPNDPQMMQALSQLLVNPYGKELYGAYQDQQPKYKEIPAGTTYGSTLGGQFTKQGETAPNRAPMFGWDTSGNSVRVGANGEAVPSNVVTPGMLNAKTGEEKVKNTPPPSKNAVSFTDDSGKQVTGIPVYNKATGKYEVNVLGGMIPKPAAGAAGQVKTGKAAYDSALDASQRYKIMLDAAKNPNPQNDVAMLFNHIGMTLSAQKGARITNAEIERAIKARSLPEDLLALYQKTKNGQFLTPEQRQDMVRLGQLNRQILWEKARSKAKYYGIDEAPQDLPGLPPLEGFEQNQPTESSGKFKILEVH